MNSSEMNSFKLAEQIHSTLLTDLVFGLWIEDLEQEFREELEFEDVI